MVPLVFIAGPYAAYEGGTIAENIQRARSRATKLADLGVHFFCPHLNSAGFQVMVPNVPNEFYYQMDLRILSHCDAAVFIEGWKYSIGALNEWDTACRLGIPTFDLTDLDQIEDFEEFLSLYRGLQDRKEGHMIPFSKIAEEFAFKPSRDAI